MPILPILGLGFFAGSPGPMELIVIFLVVLVLFGPRRLPDIAKMIGKTLHELRRASEDFKDQVMSIDTEVQDDQVPPSPMDEVVKDVSPEDIDEVFPEEDVLDKEVPGAEGEAESEEHHDLAG